MKKFVCGLMAAVMLACAIPTSAFGAETSQKSTIDLESISDKEFEDSRVSLTFVLNGNDYRYCYAAWNTTLNPNWTDDLGYPVLLDVKTGDKTLPTTWIPLRLACNSAGFDVQWMDKNATGEDNSYALVHTDNGDVRFYQNSPVVDLPDGTQYRVTEYTLEDGSPVPLVLNRKGRLYILARGLTEALFEDARFDWTRVDQLVVYANSKGSGGVPKTYGVNTNFVGSGGRMAWTKLPTFNEAVKNSSIATNAVIKDWAPACGMAFKVDGVSTGVSFGYGYEYNITDDDSKNALRIDLNYMLAYEEQRVLIDAILQDLLNDSDREQILSKLDEIRINLLDGWNENDGYSATALKWRSNYQKSYNLTEVKLQFSDGLAKFSITTK